MKIALFTALVFCFGALSGCRQRVAVESEELVEGGYITFDTEAVSSKGLEKNQFVKWDALELYALECAAWDADQSKWFFKGQELLKGSDAPTGNWTYAPLKRWPKSKVSFFAFYPSATLSAGLITNVKYEKGAPTLDYTVPNDVIKQLDLLAAVHLDVAPSKKSVPLDFKHMTSRITFSAHFTNDSIDEAYVRMHKLTLSGVYSSATLKLHDPASAVPELGGWSGHKDTVDYNVVLDNELDTINIANNPHPIVRKEHTLFMIPQALSNKKDGTDQRLVASYSYSLDKGKTWARSAYETTLADFTPIWEPGGNYNYVVAIKRLPHFLSVDSPSATAPEGYASTTLTFTVTGSQGLIVRLSKTGGDGVFSNPQPATLSCNGAPQLVTVTMAANPTSVARTATYKAEVTNLSDAHLEVSAITVKQQPNVRGLGYIVVAGDETGLIPGMMCYHGGPWTKAIYIYGVDNNNTWDGATEWCASQGMRLPSKVEMLAIWNGYNRERLILYDWLWVDTYTGGSNGELVEMGYGGGGGYAKYEPKASVQHYRCVSDY